MIFTGSGNANRLCGISIATGTPSGGDIVSYDSVTQRFIFQAMSGGAIGGASSVASGQVLYGTAAGVAGSEAAFGYNAATDTLSVFNATINNTTPTTGVTQLIVRAGAGQSTTNLLTVQNSGGATLAVIASTGDFATTGSVQSPFLLGTDNANAYLLMRGAGGASAFAGLSRWQSQFAVFSDYRIGFLSGTNINASTTGVEVAFARNSSTAIEVNNGTAGTFRDLYLRGVRPVGSTVANLPTASGNTGMIATVTDANSTTIGTTVAGGGANTVLVWSNGTNWRIYAN
jgi:hypothetical protein